jgi:small subunit ribosomal protein S1
MLALTLAAQAAGLLNSACCLSRVQTSRVAVQRTALCMCEEPATAVAEAVPEPAAEAPAPKPKRAAKTPLDELVVGSEVEGKIRSVMAFGAFIDFGAATDGLLHVSEISNEFIKDATEKLTAGETISCKIKAVNMEKGQIALTCKDPAERGGDRPRRARPDLSEFESADAKAFVSGTVRSITDFGAFVTLKEGVDGLLHISAIQEGGVGKVSDVLKIDQEVQVRVVSFDKGKRRIGLSMKPWVEGE